MQYTVPLAAVPNSWDPLGHLFLAAEAEEGVKEADGWRRRTEGGQQEDHKL